MPGYEPACQWTDQAYPKAWLPRLPDQELEE